MFRVYQKSKYGPYVERDIATVRAGRNTMRIRVTRITHNYIFYIFELMPYIFTNYLLNLNDGSLIIGKYFLHKIYAQEECYTETMGH